MNTAEQKAQQEYPNEYRLNRSSERVAYIKGYAAGQEALPLAMSEEEIERIGKSISADHEFYRDAIGVTNIIDIVRQTLHYANARSKSLTVEKGRTFTEGEVKSMLDDAEMLARIMGALVLDVDEARAMAESDISTIKVRHGISLDPA